MCERLERMVLRMEKLRTLTERFRAFNAWLDEFILELSTRLLLIGFVFGTIDVFVRGGMATTTPFMVLWATIQAVAIDGLFFAVWGMVAAMLGTMTWNTTEVRRLVALVFTGLLLSLAALVVNGIVSYQDMYNVSDSLVAMNKLGFFTPQVFVIARAFLVVACAVLVSLFCRTRAVASVQVAPTVVTERKVRQPRRVSQRRRRVPVAQETFTEFKEVPQEPVTEPIAIRPRTPRKPRATKAPRSSPRKATRRKKQLTEEVAAGIV